MKQVQYDTVSSQGQHSLKWPKTVLYRCRFCCHTQYQVLYCTRFMKIWWRRLCKHGLRHHPAPKLPRCRSETLFHRHAIIISFTLSILYPLLSLFLSPSPISPTSLLPLPLFRSHHVSALTNEFFNNNKINKISVYTPLTVCLLGEFRDAQGTLSPSI